MRARTDAAIALLILGGSILYAGWAQRSAPAPVPECIRTDINDLPAEALPMPRELSSKLWI